MTSSGTSQSALPHLVHQTQENTEVGSPLQTIVSHQNSLVSNSSSTPNEATQLIAAPPTLPLHSDVSDASPSSSFGHPLPSTTQGSPFPEDLQKQPNGCQQFLAQDSRSSRFSGSPSPSTGSSVTSSGQFRSGFDYAFILALQIFLGALAPIVPQYALWDYEKQDKVADFLPQSPYVVEFFFSVILANILALVFDGWKGLRACWDYRGIKHLFPVSLLHGMSESLELIAMRYLDGSTRAVLSQLKVPVLGGLSFVVLGRREPAARCVTVLLIFTAAVGYVWSCSGRLDVLTPTAMAGYLSIGLPTGLVSMFLAASAGICVDVTTKRNAHVSYFAQVAQLRLTTLFVMTIAMFVYALGTDSTHKLMFYGWNPQVALLVAWLLLKDYCCLYIILRLTVYHAALCAAPALVFTYIIDSFFPAPHWMGVESLFFVGILGISLILYLLIGSQNHQRGSRFKRASLSRSALGSRLPDKLSPSSPNNGLPQTSLTAVQVNNEV